jgi:tetratricopeptide (TPR) repeat protein
VLDDVYLARGQPQLAEAAYLRALDLDANLAGPYIQLGTIYGRSKQYDQALAKLDQSLRINPKSVPALMIKGIVLSQKGDMAQAQVAYEQLLNINPRFAPAANNLASLLAEQPGGDLEKALQLAQTAKEMLPEDPRISDTLGWILSKRGVHQRAPTLFKESAAKLPDNPEVQYHLGLAYLKTGEKENARSTLAAAVRSPGNFPGKEEARKTLAGLN